MVVTRHLLCKDSSYRLLSDLLSPEHRLLLRAFRHMPVKQRPLSDQDFPLLEFRPNL